MMNLHKHIWRYQPKDSNEGLDIFTCSCDSFARVIKDPTRGTPIMIEAGNKRGEKIKVSWFELKLAKSIVYRGATWVIDWI